MLIGIVVLGLCIYLGISFYKPVKIIGMIVFGLLCKIFEWALVYGFWPTALWAYWIMNVKGLK